MTRRVVVGMSGGVDSSVAALLLQRAGHEVIGATMLVYSGDESACAGTGRATASCYGPGEAADLDMAAAVCAQLGVRHVAVDLRAEFQALVLDYVRSEYSVGRTPNPCVRCNQHLKFGLLLSKLASSTGIEFDAFATGHYCRVSWLPERGRFTLCKGVDEAKDQSYFLCMLSQEQLSRVLFPLGSLTKVAVRDMARAVGLPNRDRAESQDFAAGGYREHLGLASNEGPLVSVEGEQLGTHRGISEYTIGQRRGLGCSHREPLYVTRIDAATNTVVVGPESALYESELTISDVNWMGLAEPAGPVRVSARIRYRGREAGATIAPLGDRRAVIRFEEPVRAVASGQWAVVYCGDILAAAGVID